MKILSALLGGILAPLLLIGMVILISPTSSHDNWDWATPVLTLTFAPIACVAGAVAGPMIVAALQAGAARRAAVVLLVALIVVALLPAWMASVLYGPRPVLKPVSASQRDIWAKDRIAFYQQYGFSELDGRSLAWQLRTCLLVGDCATVQWRAYDYGEDSVGANAQAYRLADDGWRWVATDGPPRGATVFLDPKLNRDAPVFEVAGHDISRRQARDAPAFSTDSALAALFAVHDCVTRFAQTARASGAWNGHPDTLGAVIAEKWSAPEGCPTIATYTKPDQSSRPWEFVVTSGQAIHERFDISPDPGNGDVPFHFAFMFAGRGFMRDANGNWHMRIGSTPYSGDPPPPRCLFDLKAACE